MENILERYENYSYEEMSLNTTYKVLLNYYLSFRSF